MTVYDQLNTAIPRYNNLVTFSSNVFATATATSNGSGGFTLAPATGETWTNDTSVVGGSGTPEAITIVVLYDPTNILSFTITQQDGSVLTIYGQGIGYNGTLIGFQAFSSYNASTHKLSGAVPGVPYFYVSDVPLGAGAAPVDGTNVTKTNTDVPVFLDPDVPAVTRPLLLNNASGQTTGGSAGGSPYASLVGLNLSSDNVSVIGNLSQNTTTLTVSAVASTLTNTFTTLFGSQTVSVVAAYNDAQVIELQYTSGGSTVDVFGQLIGFYSDATPGDGALLFKTYSGFNPTTGVLTESPAEESMPYVLLSEQSLVATAGMPATGTGGSENSFSQAGFPLGVTAHNALPFGLGVEPLNLTDTFAGHVFTSDQFLATNAGSDGSTGYNLTRTTDHHDFTSSTNATVGGAGTVETITVGSVNDTYQVVQFNITGGPNGPQTIYGKILGWNATEVGFQAFSSFNSTTGALSGAITGVPNFALTEVATTFTSSGLNLSPDVTPLNLAELPLFAHSNTPATHLDLVPLDGTTFGSNFVSTVAEVQQNPTTGNYSILSDGLNQTFTENPLFGAGSSSAGQIAVSQVFDDNGNSTTDQFQVVEVTYTGSSTTAYDVDARVIGYNPDQLLLQVLGNATSGAFNTTTGVWAPANSTEAPPGPFLVISDATLQNTNGLPVNDIFTTGGTATPFSLGLICFCTGTKISTPAGEVNVERLSVGDMVLTHSGAVRPIVWIGSGQVIVTRGHRSAATPVIVRKGALGNNVPNRDLYVTKGHSFYIDNVLIPVEFLINHHSIAWDDMAREVTIYHVELETHDVLLANGSAAESYRDDGNRWLFQNVNAGWNLPAKPPYAPVLTGGPIVDAAWRRMLDRAAPRRNVPLTANADLHLLVDGRRIDATAPSAMIPVFSLPEGARSVRIVSRSAVPAELGLVRDSRELGVAVKRIVLRQSASQHTVEASDTTLTTGFHNFEPETGIRWTNGDAELPASMFQGVGPVDLALVLGGSTQYVDAGIPALLVA